MKPKNTIAFAGACALIVSLCATTTRVGATEERPAQRQESLEEAFLGFRLGEEIRYVLERADGERRGRSTTWSIRLEESDRETGVFELTYEVGRFGGVPGSPQGEGGVLMAYTTATAWVNAYGFPTRVRFTTQRMTPMGGIGYTVEYRYEERRFIKELEASGKDQKVKLDDYLAVDLDTPAGLYLFMPVDGECVVAARQLQESRGGGGGGGGGSGGTRGARGGRGDMDEPCLGREPVFANPGLLNLTMPALWESGTGSVELLAMAPTGVLTRVLMGVGNPGGGGSGITIGGYNLLGGGGPNPFDDAEDAFQMFGLTAEGDLMQLEVGGRSVDVWKLRASPPLDAVYVDGNGSIVRLDLPADPETGERYWIRRLRPSEY